MTGMGEAYVGSVAMNASRTLVRSIYITAMLIVRRAPDAVAGSSSQKDQCWLPSSPAEDKASGVIVSGQRSNISALPYSE